MLSGERNTLYLLLISFGCEVITAPLLSFEELSSSA